MHNSFKSFHEISFRNEGYPIDRRRKAGAKPRNIEVSLDKRPTAEKSGRTREKPTKRTIYENRSSYVNLHNSP